MDTRAVLLHTTLSVLQRLLHPSSFAAVEKQLLSVYALCYYTIAECKVTRIGAI